MCPKWLYFSVNSLEMRQENSMQGRYSKTVLAKSAFNRYLAELSAAGLTRIAGERTLAARFGVSRQTVRKIISEALVHGKIRRSGRKLFNSLPGGTLAGCGRILFISVGNNGKFFYPAMKRLYDALATEVAAENGDICAFLCNDRTSAERFAIEIGSADVILLAIIACKEKERLSGIISQAAAEKPLIRLCGTDSFVPPEQENFITADNYQIGKCAAKLLMDSRCRKPLAFWKRVDNRNFAERAQGFCDTLFQAKCGGVQSVFWLDPGRYAAEISRLLPWAMEHGYDGFFVMSDEKIGDTADLLYDRTKQQWRFPLVTVDGSQDSRRFDPPVCAVGHGTAYCCTAIMETLQEIADKKFKRVRKLIKPDYHHASSLALPEFDSR